MYCVIQRSCKSLNIYTERKKGKSIQACKFVFPNYLQVPILELLWLFLLMHIYIYKFSFERYRFNNLLIRRVEILFAVLHSHINVSFQIFKLLVLSGEVNLFLKRQTILEWHPKGFLIATHKLKVGLLSP